MVTYEHFDTVVGDRANWTLPRTLRRAAEQHGDDVFLIVPADGDEITYRQLQDQVERILGSLQTLGAEAGDRLLVMAENSADFVRTWFAAACGGMIEVPLNVAYSGRFLSHQIETVQPRFAVIDAEFADRFLQITEACHSIEHFFVRSAAAEGGSEALTVAIEALRGAGWDARPFEELLTGPAGRVVDVRPSDVESVMFTSGTTGPSKGVMMTHAHMHFFAEQWAHIMQLSEDDVFLTCLPLFHGNAQFITVYPAMIVGASTVIEKRFSASRWLGWVRDHGVTVTNVMGGMMDFLWKQPPTDVDADHSLRCINASPIATALEADFKARFGVEQFVEGYGMTETSSILATPYGVERPANSCGVVLDQWFDVALLDPDTDEEVLPGAVGEVALRPKVPWITTVGYYGMPERTLEATRNLWFRTGDSMRRDEDGWYYFEGRLKDALRKRGENISSYEVEQAILEHPAVLECAVVGVPADEVGGEEEVLVFVVPRPGAEMSPQELWSWCEPRLPGFAAPRYVAIVDDLPKTPTHKVEKAKLRARGVDADTADRLRRPVESA